MIWKSSQAFEIVYNLDGESIGTFYPDENGDIHIDLEDRDGN